MHTNAQRERASVLWLLAAGTSVCFSIWKIHCHSPSFEFIQTSELLMCFFLRVQFNETDDGGNEMKKSGKITFKKSKSKLTIVESVEFCNLFGSVALDISGFLCPLIAFFALFVCVFQYFSVSLYPSLSSSLCFPVIFNIVSFNLSSLLLHLFQSFKRLKFPPFLCLFLSFFCPSFSFAQNSDIVWKKTSACICSGKQSSSPIQKKNTENLLIPNWNRSGQKFFAQKLRNSTGLRMRRNNFTQAMECTKLSLR